VPGLPARAPFEAVTDFDTAGAAKLLAENGGEGKAALASKRAAEAYGLEVLAENVEDLAFNYTRFFVLGAADAEPRGEGPHKTSLVLATRHRPGDLVDCLVEFPKHGINMTKLESRPRRDKPWSYLFYIDIEGHVDEPRGRRADRAHAQGRVRQVPRLVPGRTGARRARLRGRSPCPTRDRRTRPIPVRRSASTTPSSSPASPAPAARRRC
jgi:hypothetical protein